MQQHFWLLCGLWCGLLGAGYARYQLRKGIEAGEFTKEEVRSFTFKTALWVLVPCLVLWFLQLSISSDSTPQYFLWPRPQRYLALALQVFVWAALLYWVFLRDGASTLSRYARAARRSESLFNSPLAIKLGAIAVVLAGTAALLQTGA